MIRAIGYRKSLSPSKASGEGASAPAELRAAGDFDFAIARDGTWYYQGTPIARRRLVRLFAGVLRREDDGGYWLVTPVERVRVHVKDAPFTAVELRVDGAGRKQVLSFRTNLDDWVDAGPAHPIRVEHAPETGEPAPYILVRDRLEALIVRSVFYELVELAVPGQRQVREVLGVWSQGTFFPLGETGAES